MFKLIHALFLMSTLASTMCFAGVRPLPPEGGSVSGGGGADYHVDATAWFTTSDRNKAVNICIQVAENFGQKTSELRTLTESSFNTWAKYYIDAHGLDQRSSEICPIGEGRKGYRIATNANVSEFCTGNEDLTVYFGVMNPDLQKRKDKYFLPVGFAELVTPLSSSKHQDAWSPGLIWITPPYESVAPTSTNTGTGGIYWNSYGGAVLEFLLLHEMGHVFGNGHIDYTVMRDSTGNEVINKAQKINSARSRQQLSDFFLHIDQNRYLIYTPDADKEIELLPDLPYQLNSDRFRDVNGATFKQSFELLTGMSLMGEDFSARIKALPDLTKPLSAQASVIEITGDGHTHQVRFKPYSSSDQIIAKAFNEGCHSMEQHYYSVSGDLYLLDGSKKSVTLNINSYPGTIEIVEDRPSANNTYCSSYGRSDHCVLLRMKYE